MKLRLPLYLRFLGWFFLNLLLLAAVFVVLIRTEFRLDSLMSSLAGDRVQQVADVLFSEIRTRPREQWGEALARFEQAYGIEFSLLDERYDYVAGTQLTVPETMRESIRGPGRPVGPDNRSHLDEAHPVDDRTHPRPSGGRMEPRIRRAFFRSKDPSLYWAVVRAPLPGSDRGRPTMGLLVVRSKTLGAGGLFFDFTPWWMAGGAVLLVSAVWWLPFVRSITRSIGQMTAATEQIAEGRFDVVVRDRRSDELGRLGGAINRMSGRLSGFVTGQKRFLGDIAHELCSPLARMEMALGVLDQRADPSQKEYLQDVRDEVRHMSELVNELLLFSKAGLKPKDVPLQPVALDPLLRAVVNRECPSGEGVHLHVPSDLEVLADPERLARGVANLVRNALRYAGHAGPVRVAAFLTEDQVKLSVSDDGPGVSEADLKRLGEPFFRPDQSRGRETGGTGLGLAIVRSCVEACGGTLVLQNRRPHGFEATLFLQIPKNPTSPRVVT